MANLYRDESYDPKSNAQRNLSGRTHYVDDDTLRFHKSRVLWANPVCNGLMFVIVESYAVDMGNTRRAFRPVVFNLYGRVLSRPDLENGFKSTKTAIKAMYEYLNSIDEYDLTRQSIDKAQESIVQECQWLRDEIDRHENKYRWETESCV